MIKVYKSLRGSNLTLTRAKRVGGVLEPLPPVHFLNGLLRTSSLEVQRYIENSSDFGRGIILHGATPDENPVVAALGGAPSPPKTGKTAGPPVAGDPAPATEAEKPGHGLTPHYAPDMNAAKFFLEERYEVDASELNTNAETVQAGYDHGVEFVNLLRVNEPDEVPDPAVKPPTAPVAHNAANMTAAKLVLEKEHGVDVSGLRTKAATAKEGLRHGIDFVNL